VEIIKFLVNELFKEKWEYVKEDKRSFFDEDYINYINKWMVEDGS